MSAFLARVSPRAPLVVAAGVALVVAWPRLPAAKPASAPPAAFAAERALVHIRAWAVTPRPSGSPAHAAVVDAAEAELERLGFVVAREETRGLTNLVASAPEAPPDGGVWLVAHSDTVAVSPGAADDGLGLGVAMEAARALAVDGVPRDLHVLLTDGEEEGLLGAESHAAGVAGRGALQEPRVVLNVEARGTEGPAYMFQLAGPSAALLDVWQASGCTAQATSLARAVYDQLPNDTDFTVFRRAGWWGYDFALIGGAARYHSPEDTPEHLDPRSVQQVGDCVTGLARGWLGRGVSSDAVDAARVYFQVPGGTVVVPPALVQTFGLAALLALPRPRGWAASVGLGAWLVAPFVAGMGGFGLYRLILALGLDSWERGTIEMAAPAPWYVAAAALGMAVAAGLAWLGGLLEARLRGREDPPVGWGWHAATIALAAVAACAVPTAGYVLVPGAWVSVFLARGVPRLAVVPALLAGLVVTPVLCAIYPALTTGMLPILTVVPVLLLGWLLGPVAPARP
ncbi:MAG: M28 family peptidase [Pseudomonadota bacterium]|nr:M28 family peptidase [Pseudomonadota bacterium]